jgi:hypothetical protein
MIENMVEILVSIGLFLVVGSIFVIFSIVTWQLIRDILNDK